METRNQSNNNSNSKESKQTHLNVNPTQQYKIDQVNFNVSTDLSSSKIVHEQLQQFIDSDPEFIELNKFYEINNTADMRELFDHANGKGSWELYLTTARNHALLEDIRLAPDKWVMLTAGLRTLKTYLKNPEKTEEKISQRRSDATQIAEQQKLAIILTKTANNKQQVINRHLQYAQEFYKQHNYSQTIFEATKVISLKADCVEAYLLRGDSYYDSNKLQEADNDYTQAINLGSQNIETYLKRGLIRGKLGDLYGSFVDVAKATKLDSKHKYSLEKLRDKIALKVRLQFAKELYESGDYSKGISRATEAITTNPDCIDAYLLRANSYLKIEQYKKAEIDYTKVISLDSNNQQAYLNRAKARIKLGNSSQEILDDVDHVLQSISQEHSLFAMAQSLRKQVQEEMKCKQAQEEMKRKQAQEEMKHKQAQEEMKRKQAQEEMKHKQANEEALLTSSDPFFILGVSNDAKTNDIKKAYFKLILQNHPDKIKQKDVKARRLANLKTSKITWAYKVLTDQEERIKWEASQASNDNPDSQSNEESTGPYQTITTSKERLSASYRRYFADLDKLFQTSPLKPLSKEAKEKVFDTLNDLSNNKHFGEDRYQHLYRVKQDGLEYSDIYEFIAHLENWTVQTAKLDDNFLKEDISPEKAINLLLKFLSGEFYGDNLEAVKKYFQNEVSKLYQLNNPIVTLYRSIESILKIKSIEKEYQTLLNAVEGIYSFAYQQNKTENSNIVQLMQDRYFRYLVANAHRYYWKDNNNHTVNGSLLAKIKTEYANIRKVFSLNKIIFNIEQKLSKVFSKESNVEDIYECAYLLIDLSNSYIPTASAISSSMLAALCFQLAAHKEQDSRAMAAEHLALCSYQKAMTYAFKAGGATALYAYTHIPKYLSELIYDQSTLDRELLAESLTQPGDAKVAMNAGSTLGTIKGAIKKALYLLDIFPFYTNFKSILDFEIIAIHQLGLVRALLESLLNEEEHNKEASFQDYAKLVYQAYEDSIQKWWAKQRDLNEQREQEITFKLQTIDSLMKKDNSNVDEMIELIADPYIHMQRDEEGWLEAAPELYFPDEANIKIYKSFDGYKVNFETGEVTLLLKEWQEGDPRSQRLFTDYDIFQMMGGIKRGALSLDHLDPNKKLHPLQMVRYTPNNIQGTEYLKTLFMTDYLLKMFATGTEVSAKPPYHTRKIDKLLASLPDELREILHLYGQKKSRKLRNHRFWIQTEEIEREKVSTDQKVEVYFGDVEVAVKKHLMVFNAAGKLEDAKVDNEDNSREAKFAQGMTKFYDKIGEYFPEFLRLKQLVKIAGAISDLTSIHDQNKLEIQNYNDYLNNKSEWAKLFEENKKNRTQELTEYCQSLPPDIQQAHPIEDEKWWNEFLDKKIIEESNEFQKLYTTFPKFTYQLQDPEVVQDYNRNYQNNYNSIFQETYIANYGHHAWKHHDSKHARKARAAIDDVVKKYLATEFTQQHMLNEYNRIGANDRERYRQFYYNDFIHLREKLGETNYNNCINSFIAGDCMPLARASATHVLEMLKAKYLKLLNGNLNVVGEYKSVTSEIKLKQAVEELLSGKVENLATIFAEYAEQYNRNEIKKTLDKKNALEKTFQDMQFTSTPDKREPFSPTKLRAPSLFHQDSKGYIYGGVVAYPKFRDRMSLPTLFSQPSYTQHQVARDAKSLISNYNRNTHFNKPVPSKQETRPPALHSFRGPDPFVTFRAKESEKRHESARNVAIRNMAIDGIKSGNSMIAKISEMSIHHSKLPTSEKRIATRVLKYHTTMFNGGACLTQNLANGVDLDSSLRHCAQEQIKDSVKETVETAVSGAAAKGIGKVTGAAVGRVAARTLGAFIGEMLAPTETAPAEKDCIPLENRRRHSK